MIRKIIYLIGTITMALIINNVSAQDKQQMVRIAKIEVDPTQSSAYNVALKEQMAAAIKSEPGVLTYYAVADKLHPEKITILEIYADTAAYNSHIQTSHFRKYKATVQHMVKSLELDNVSIVGIAKKPNL